MQAMCTPLRGVFWRPERHDDLAIRQGLKRAGDDVLGVDGMAAEVAGDAVDRVAADGAEHRRLADLQIEAVGAEREAAFFQGAVDDLAFGQRRRDAVHVAAGDRATGRGSHGAEGRVGRRWARHQEPCS